MAFKTFHFVPALSRTPLLFVPRCLTNIFFRKYFSKKSKTENSKRRAPEFGSKSAQKIIGLVNYGAIWCQIGSQFLSPKTCEFSMEAAGAADKNQDWTPRQNLPAA
jgi:hypothetical protein